MLLLLLFLIKLQPRRPPSVCLAYWLFYAYLRFVLPPWPASRRMKVERERVLSWKKESQSAPRPCALCLLRLMSHSQTSPRHILAENLSILGFKPTNNTNSHYSGVVVDQDAFSGANNTKAFELMSWFLFNKLDSHKAKKVSSFSTHCTCKHCSKPFNSCLHTAGPLWITARNQENTDR